VRHARKCRKYFARLRRLLVSLDVTRWKCGSPLYDNDPIKGTLCFARCRGSLFSLNRLRDFFDARTIRLAKRKTETRARLERESTRDSCLTRGELRSPFLSTTEPSGTRGPRKRACILFRAVSVPCGQQGSRQYLCRRNCPPTSKGVSKRINFTRRREKGVNI